MILEMMIKTLYRNQYLILLLMCLLHGMRCQAQIGESLPICPSSHIPDPSQNYVMSVTLLDSLGNNSSASIQYYDALGRPSVSCVSGPTAMSNYLLSSQTYDRQGRVNTRMLPVNQGNTTAGTIATLESKAKTIYDDTKPYQSILYDALGRPVSYVKPGSAWHDSGRCRSVDYVSNRSQEVKRYRLNSQSLPEQDGYYPALSLTGEVVTDEDGVSVTTYRDASGRTVMERRGEGGNTCSCTYYVYDTHDCLRLVLPPLYETTQDERLLYQYGYDNRHRLTKKIIPGCDAIQYRYDRDGRLAFERDGRLRGKGLSRFYLYDSLGRMVVQGVCSGFPSFQNKQATATYSSVGPGLCNTGYLQLVGYTLQNPQIEQVCYYDNYECLSHLADFCPIGGDEQTLSRPAPTPATGLLTAAVTSTSDGSYLCQVHYYDAEGRVIDTRESMPGNRFLQTEVQYTFTGKPKQTHYALSQNALRYSVVESHSYSTRNGQLFSTSVAYGDSAAVQVANYQYDEVGRNSQIAQQNQSIHTSYTYNIQGWPTKISTTASTPLFEQQLYYNDPADAQPCYNGSVAQMSWRVGDATSVTHDYAFLYDGVNRMVRADYSCTPVSGEPDYSVELEYNANSSPVILVRHGRGNSGHGETIDSLSYHYEGNQLRDIVDAHEQNLLYAGSFEQPCDRTVGIDDNSYGYDTCGSLLWDANKGIVDIQYDLLGHPIHVQTYEGHTIDYVYASDGRKLQATYTTAVSGIFLEAGETLELDKATTLHQTVRSYEGPFVRENSHTYFPFDGGYMDIWQHFQWGRIGHGPLKPRLVFTPTYHYYVRDHQGNNRLVVSAEGEIEQVNHYYPYGGLFGADEEAEADDDLQPYKYNGKELHRMHGLWLYDYGARQYDPAHGLFTSIDPLCEKYYHVSPYMYCEGNPVNGIDPDGRDWYQNNQTSYYTWYDGDGAREGFTHIGGKGSVLGEFESIIDGILTDPKGPNLESLYSNGFTFDIAPNDKGALIGSKERGWDFFDEFINGSGPEFSVLLGSHPYTQQLMSDDVVVSAQNQLRRGETDVKGQITGVGRDWGLFDVFTHSSLAKQFIGSYRYDGYISRDGRHINNVVFDSKSNTSLGYRLFNEHRRSHKNARGNTYQFYIWQSIK